MHRTATWFRTGLRVGVVLAPLAFAAPVFAQQEPLHDCGKRLCGEWAEKGDKTCRTCKTAQCKTIDGKDALAGNKNETECFEGHGTPPPDEDRE